MIQITIEKITIIKDGMDTMVGKRDRWERQTIYMQVFENMDNLEISKVIRVANKEVP